MADFNAGSIESQLTLNRDPFTQGLLDAKKQGEDFAKNTFTAKVKVDNGEALLALDDVQMRADEVGALHPTVKVDADTATTDTKLAATKKASKDLADNGFHPLMLAALALGPALIPLGALAVAGVGAAALTLGSVALGIKGASDEMKAGTPIGKQYTAGIGELQAGLSELEKTAATGILPAFNNAVAQADRLLPNLNSEVSKFSVIGGNIADHVLHGLIGGFLTLEPLFTQLGIGAEHLADDFDRYANGGGLAKFQAWTQENLPEIERDVTEIAVAITHLVEAIGPLGLSSLSTLTLIARAINAIPVGVLQDLLPVVVDLYLAFKAYQLLDNVAGILSKIGSSAGGAAAGFATLGALVVAGSFALSNYLEKGNTAFKVLGDVKDITKTLTTAIEADNNALGENTRSAIANALQQEGLSDKLKASGISLSDLTDVVMENDQQFNNTMTSWIAAGKISGDTAVAIKALHGSLSTATTNANDYTAAMDKATPATESFANVIQDNLNKQLTVANSSVNDLVTAMNTYQKSTGTTADKSALLGAVLKDSQGDMLSFSGAMAQGTDAAKQLFSAFAQDQVSLKQGSIQLNDTEKAAIDLKTGLIDTTKNGAVPLLSQLQNMQDAATKAAQATYQHELATKGDSAALQDAQNIFEQMTGGTLVQNAKQLGLTAGQAQSLADQYFRYDGKTVTTAVQSVGLSDINDTLTQIGELLAKITGQPWDVKLNFSAYGFNNATTAQLLTKAAKDAGIIGQADGGMVVGEGTGTSDSVLRRLSAGEFVMPASVVSQPGMQSLLESMRNGAAPMTSAITRVVTALPSSVNNNGMASGKLDQVSAQLGQLAAITQSAPAQIGSEVAGQLSPVLARQTAMAHQQALMRGRQGAVGANSNGS